MIKLVAVDVDDAKAKLKAFIQQNTKWPVTVRVNDANGECIIMLGNIGNESKQWAIDNIMVPYPNVSS